MQKQTPSNSVYIYISCVARCVWQCVVLLFSEVVDVVARTRGGRVIRKPNWIDL